MATSPIYFLATFFIASVLVSAQTLPTTECSLTKPCATGSFCSYAVGSCGANQTLGSCTALAGANACVLSEFPTCGCDGKTYQNACMAAQAGVSLASEGNCSSSTASNVTPTAPAPGTQNVTACQTKQDCPSNQFCVFQIGSCGGKGECYPSLAPNACDITVKEPFCGCDKKVYQNLCMAYQQEVSLKSIGNCSEPVVGGNCTTNGDCGAGTFCNFVGTNCSGNGSCVPVPTSCPETVTPVCGCDGLAYQNQCAAQTNLVSMGPNNSCFIPTPCSDQLPCNSTSTCQHDFGVCRGEGFCIPKPPTEGGCLVTVKNPVCGCDNRNYDNQCLAVQAGVSILSNGTCESSSNTNETITNNSTDNQPSEAPQQTGNATVPTQGNGNGEPSGSPANFWSLSVFVSMLLFLSA